MLLRLVTGVLMSYGILGTSSYAAPTYVIALVAGDGQRQVMKEGSAAFAPLVVRVSDVQKKPVAGLAVRFVCSAPHEGCYLGSVQGGPSAVVRTGRDGRAVLGSSGFGVYVYWTRQFYTRKNPSPVTVSASLPDGTSAVKFQLAPINPYSLL